MWPQSNDSEVPSNSCPSDKRVPNLQKGVDDFGLPLTESWRIVNEWARLVVITDTKHQAMLGTGLAGKRYWYKLRFE